MDINYYKHNALKYLGALELDKKTSTILYASVFKNRFIVEYLECTSQIIDIDELINEAYVQFLECTNTIDIFKMVDKYFYKAYTKQYRYNSATELVDKNNNTFNHPSLKVEDRYNLTDNAQQMALEYVKKVIDKNQKNKGVNFTSGKQRKQCITKLSNVNLDVYEEYFF